MSRKKSKRNDPAFDAAVEKTRLAKVEEYKGKVDDMLKGFNQEAFEWQPSEERRVYRECRHLMASRRDPNHDFYGYELKMHFEHANETIFLRTCRTCIESDLSLLEFAVACVRYSVLSEAGMRSMVVSTMKDGLTIEATSERGKKIIDDVFQAHKVN